MAILNLAMTLLSLSQPEAILTAIWPHDALILPAFVLFLAYVLSSQTSGVLGRNSRLGGVEGAGRHWKHGGLLAQVV